MGTPLFLSWLIAYRYVVIFPLAIIEGPILMLVCGFLVRLGGLDLLPTYLLLVAGDFAGDIAWYAVGRHGARTLVDRFGRFLSLRIEDIERFEDIFHTHQIKILFISKLTMGFGFALATLIAAGAARIPFRTYVLVNGLGGFIWTALLMAVGFSFGHFYLAIDEGLRMVTTLASATLFLLVAWGAIRALRTHLRTKTNL